MSNNKPWTTDEFKEAAGGEAKEAQAAGFTGSINITLHYFRGALNRVAVQKASDLIPAPAPKREFRQG